MKVEVLFKNGHRERTEVDGDTRLLRFVADQERAQGSRVKQIRVIGGGGRERGADEDRGGR